MDTGPENVGHLPIGLSAVSMTEGVGDLADLRRTLVPGVGLHRLQKTKAASW